MYYHLPASSPVSSMFASLAGWSITSHSRGCLTYNVYFLFLKIINRKQLTFTQKQLNFSYNLQLNKNIVLIYKTSFILYVTRSSQYKYLTFYVKSKKKSAQFQIQFTTFFVELVLFYNSFVFQFAIGVTFLLKSKKNFVIYYKKLAVFFQCMFVLN